MFESTYNRICVKNEKKFVSYQSSKATVKKTTASYQPNMHLLIILTGIGKNK